MNRLKKLTILVSSVLTLSAHTVAITPAVIAEDVDPAYGAENGFDLINLQKRQAKSCPC